jgi:hypothetical protein
MCALQYKEMRFGDEGFRKGDGISCHWHQRKAMTVSLAELRKMRQVTVSLVSNVGSG